MQVPDVQVALNVQAASASTSSKTKSLFKQAGFSPDRITAAEKEELDLKLISMTVNCMFSFLAIENPFFIDFFKRLRPAYTLPSRRVVSNMPASFPACQLKYVHVAFQLAVLPAGQLVCSKQTLINQMSLISL